MRCARRLLQFGGGSMSNFGAGGGGGALNPFADLMQQGGNAKGNRFDGNFQRNDPFLNPDALASMRQHMQTSLTPEMQKNIQQMMSNMQQGKADFGKIGVMAFGVGENERGKKVARGAKMEFDPNTGKMSTDFHEQQLDPDDPMLPKETVENYDTSNCIEVELEGDKLEGKNNGSGGGDVVLETEIEIESISEDEEKKKGHRRHH